MRKRRSVVKVLAERYRKAAKKEKDRTADELVGLTGYNRWYAARLLCGHGEARSLRSRRRACRRRDQAVVEHG